MNRTLIGPWFVYVLIDPRNNKVFYVGCSVAPKERLKAHKYSMAGSAWLRCAEIRDSGLRPEVKSIRRFTVRQNALEFESKMIRETPGLVNLSIHPVGCDCDYHKKYPKTVITNSMHEKDCPEDIVAYHMARIAAEQRKQKRHDQ